MAACRLQHFASHLQYKRLFLLWMQRFQLHSNSPRSFFSTKQMSAYSRIFIFFAMFLPHTKSFIWLTMCVPGRKLVWIQRLIIQLFLQSLWKEKMLSMFKQLVHVAAAAASASRLHFPVSERQMNRNDCFVRLCSHLSGPRKTQMHKTYVLSLPCVILYLQRGGRKGGTLELGIAVLQRWRSFFYFLRLPNYKNDLFHCSVLLKMIWRR